MGGIPASKAPAEAGRLDSWKEIASYLRRGARTVQRWEREEGLPVHRLQHEKLGSVYAYRSELDSWFARRGAELEPDAVATPSAPSVAVLPFLDLSQEGDQAYFCDGVAEEIVNALSRVEGLKTASRTSSFRFRTPGADSREIGAQLGVQSLLEGSVRRSGDRLRIAVQLVDAESGFQRWAERYDRQAGDIFAIQDEIAERVAQALKGALTPRDENTLRTPATTDLDAYDFYLRGRKCYYEYSQQSIETAIRMFVRAIECDPGYAQAYAGLADCWSYLYCSDRCDAVREQADWASSKAQQMDPQSAQAQASRGLSLSSKRADRRRGPGVPGGGPPRSRAFRSALLPRAPLLCAGAARRSGGSIRTRDGGATRRLSVAAARRPDRGRPGTGRPRGCASQARHRNRRAAPPGRSRRRSDALHGRERTRRAGRAGAGATVRRACARARSPDDPMLLYNVGCVFSILGLTEPALDCLEKAARAVSRGRLGAKTTATWMRSGENSGLRDCWGN